MSEPTLDEIAATYATTRAGLVAELRRVSDEEAGRIVPSCPEWTVKDVVAHVSGLVADVIAEVPPPLGAPAVTARQVDERAGMSLDEICDEWVGNAERFAPLLTAVWRRAIGLTADLTVHVHDLAEMLDSVSLPSDQADRIACELYVPLLQERVAERLDIALSVRLDDRVWTPTAGTVPLTMVGGHTDFLRSITGRRTRRQVEDQFEWQGDPALMLDQAFTQYGPYRTE